MPSNNKQSASAKTSTIANNKFAPLGPHTEVEEKKVHKERQDETHKVIDKIWQSLLVGRSKCRSLQYQFNAAVLIEKEDLPEGEGGVKELMESILIDARMGDHHISTLPEEYHEKMRLCTTKTFLDDENIKGNVNKYSSLLQKWHSDLIKKINHQIGDNYIAKDASGKRYIINSYRDQIKKIIINDETAQKIRKELNLTERRFEEKQKAVDEQKPKTGLDYYLDYLLAENNDIAQESLKKAMELGYVENASKAKEIISDEYYIEKSKVLCRKGDYKKVEELLIAGATKGSASIRHLLSDVYHEGMGTIKKNLAKSLQYCKSSAEQGFVLAQHDLAHNYVYGLCGIKKTPENINIGLEWFRKATAQNHAPSLNDLANIYYGHNGNIIKKNIQEAINLWKRAADQEFALSQHALGIHYIENSNTNEGIQLVTKAADQGMALAQYYLGGVYVNDIIVPRNLSTALVWLEKSAAQGYEEAVKYLKDNKAGFDIIRKENEENKYPKYFITFAGIDEQTAIKRVEKIEELLKKIGLNNSNVEKDVRGDRVIAIKAPLKSDHLTKEVRELLGIDRGRFDKITPEQQINLQSKLPNVTIEEDPNDIDKMLITWPIVGDRKKYREFVDKSLREVKAHPGPVIIHPIAEATDISKISDRSPK